MLTHTYYPGYTVPSPVAEGEDSYDPPVAGSKKPWYETKPLDEVRAILAESLPILMRRKTAQEVEVLRRRGVSQLREGNFTGDHWQALAYLEQRTGKQVELSRAATAASSSVASKSAAQASGYFYSIIPDRDVPRDALARMRRAYERSCQQLRLGLGERPDMAIVSESRVKGPGCIHESDHRVRGFCHRAPGKGIAIVLEQEPICQMQAVAHECYHWALYVKGVSEHDEEEQAQAFGEQLVRSLAY